MSVIVFEDDLVRKLYPITIGRPAFTITCGSYRLISLLDRLGRPVGAIVRPHLKPPLEADCAELFSVTDGLEEDRGSDEPVLLVNARMVPAIGAFNRLKELLKEGQPAVVYTDGSVAAALLAPRSPRPPTDGDGAKLAEYFKSLQVPTRPLELPLFEYPHDVLRHHRMILGENLEDRLSTGDYREISDGLFAAGEVTLGQYVVTVAREGPILLEEGASIGPYCYLSGPAHVGARARVIEHAAIKDAVTLGHTTKLGGEVESSIIEPYTNKQHHGFLGHSYLGSWVNLGAGTCNSDLKNTYGQVSMEYDGRKVATEMQFIGCIIGDYAKTAVNTSIFTGKTIGVCTMVYGFVTTNVPSFVNYARSFGQVTETSVEVMIATQARMFHRRNVTQRPCHEQLLHDMYGLTRHERRLAIEPLSL